MAFGTIPQPKQQEQLPPAPKICAVLSTGRLGFADFWTSSWRSFGPFGIAFKRCCGAYWGQIIERTIDECVSEGYDWIITLDNDSWFTPDHVRVLCQLMVHSQQMLGGKFADAIIPIQTMRDNEHPMFVVQGQDGKPLSGRHPSSIMQAPLVPVLSGHFGLTLIRTKALKKMPHPWYWDQPGPDGKWGEGHLDADMYFWKQFREAGNQAYLAPGICLGHLQQVVTFTGTPENNWEPIHVYMQKADRGEIPAHCKPVPIPMPQTEQPQPQVPESIW